MVLCWILLQPIPSQKERNMSFEPPISLQRFCQLTGIAPSTCHAWRYTRSPDAPRFYRLGRTLVIDRADLEDWLAARKEATTR